MPQVEGDKPSRKKFDCCPIDYFHIDLDEVRPAEGKLYFFVAIDRTSKFVVTQLLPKANVRAAADFLQPLVAAVPYSIHNLLTDSSIQFADLPRNRNGVDACWCGHLFDRLYLAHNIQYRLTKPNPHEPMARSNA